MKYATDLTGSWTLSNLGSGGYVTSITVDGNDKVHIVHFRAGNQLTYTTNASGSWVSTVIGVNGGYFASVKTDSANKVHVSYYASGAVNYMTNASGAWVNTVIDNAVGIAGNSSLVLDSLGGVHISYCNYNDNDLQYATNASGAWLNSIADQEGNVGYFSSLAIDGQDLLYVTYTDRTNGKVKFAYTLAGEEEEESDNLCFIATAAFGSPLAGQVALLRRFRDHCLLTNRPGAAFVSWYYRKGPLAARYIAPRPLARAAVRLVLYPLIAFSFLALNGWLLPGLILLAAVGAWLFWVQERRRTPAVL
ncbi:MAG: hypothetical protein BWY73_01346 [candidate division TA06 bacterium ADurb.Bin417]|uniref:Uncharacterized protein n=1 Tax=candidate division TA06 bacterium ADurb.Bin417 TaxID=1852828 RepID=A0A1V5MAM4_UNCT6|nr:MAG: hypothetical protein BWY73_01346 [candidate division TA06 bacterium ADurb.Bin417]